MSTLLAFCSFDFIFLLSTLHYVPPELFTLSRIVLVGFPWLGNGPTRAWPVAVRRHCVARFPAQPHLSSPVLFPDCILAMCSASCPWFMSLGCLLLSWLFCYGFVLATTTTVGHGQHPPITRSSPHICNSPHHFDILDFAAHLLGTFLDFSEKDVLAVLGSN